MNKKYIIIGIIILLIIPLIIIVKKDNQTRKSLTQLNQEGISQTSHSSFTIDDTSLSPTSNDAITHSEIFLESAQSNNTTEQKFVVKSPVDGSERDLFLTNQAGLTFEKITPKNWSPTNRFLFIYADDGGKRDVLFLKTDGRFTNAQYFIHSTSLYPDLTVTNAQWTDTAALSLQTLNVKTHVSGKYVVDFDDDTGIMMPASLYYSNYGN